MLQSLKLAGGSLSSQAAFNLGDWLSVNPLQPSRFMEACLIRAANKTFVGFEEMHEELVQLSLHRHLSQICSKVGVPGWDTDAFCTNLVKGKRCVDLPHAGQNSNELYRIQCNYNNGELKGSLQKQIYKALSARSSCVWADVIRHKVNLILPAEFKLEQLGCSQFNLFHKQFLSMNTKIRTSVFKTYINSWATSARMQERRVLPCIFGCDTCRDDLQHYLLCPPLWAIVCASATHPPPRVMWDLSPRERLCLLAPTPLGMRMLAVASRGYHTIKLGHREKVEAAIASGDFAAIHSCLFDCVRDCWVQIGPGGQS